MTVKELIKTLEAYPKDMEVIVYDVNECFHGEIISFGKSNCEMYKSMLVISIDCGV